MMQQNKKFNIYINKLTTVVLTSILCFYNEEFPLNQVVRKMRMQYLDQVGNNEVPTITNQKSLNRRNVCPISQQSQISTNSESFQKRKNLLEFFSVKTKE